MASCPPRGRYAGHLMHVDPSTPVIVGVGQVTNRPGTEGDQGLTFRPEPVDLMVEAIERALEDCDGGSPGGPAPVGRRLLERLQSVRVVAPVTWEYVNPAELVATRMGREVPELMVTTPGGNSPQALVNATALAIARGDLEVALITGGDAGFTQTAAQRHPDRPVLPWTVQLVDTPEPLIFGTDLAPSTAAEEARGLDAPLHVYPLFEHAWRDQTGRTPNEHVEHLGTLWAGASQVAAGNPYAWLPAARSPEELVTVGDDNRMVAPPYRKLLCADNQVDQAAALLMCSAAEAEAAGVPRERWVFPLAGADAADHWFLSHRENFHSSPAIRLSGQAALTLLGITIDEVAHFDLYSCFPSAVEIASAELGMDPTTPFTVTGGMTFAGGPGFNYSSHGIATMVHTLRQDPGSIGLVTGVGFYLTRHSLGLYGTEPGPVRGGGVATADLPENIAMNDSGGFLYADPQRAVAALPQCAPDGDAEGEITVETYSIACGRDGTPERAVVAGRTPEGRRTWANVTDADQLNLLMTEEGCGRLGTLRPDGELDLS